MLTGVSSGFGCEMTRQLLEKGDTVVGTVRNPKKVEDLIQKYPGTFDCEILDVTDVPAVQKDGERCLLQAQEDRCGGQRRRLWPVRLRRGTDG